jgi:TolB-like protein/Tfp pilus assembly protein PilF
MVIELRRLRKETTRVVRQAVDEKTERAPLSRIARVGRHWKWMVPVFVIALAVAAYFIFFPRAERIDSLAVMPFVNVAVNPDVEYLSDGITESIINSLSQLPSLRVVPRTTVFKYKGKEIEHEEIARKLNVRAILTGKVVQRGDDLSVQVELVDAIRQSQLWGEQFTRKTTDLLSIQQDIVREVSKSLEGRLDRQAYTRLSKGSTNDNEAFQLYLRGRYYWNKRSEESLKRSLECFEQAIEKDPSYALAYAGIADAYIVMGDWDFLQSRDAYPKAKAAAQKALAIDGSLGEAQTSLAMVIYEYDWEWESAEREFKRAIELSPNYPTAHQWYSEFLTSQQRFKEAVAEAQRAKELDPLSPIISVELARVYLSVGDNEKCIQLCLEALELDPGFYPAHVTLIWCYAVKGMDKEALEESEKIMKLRGASSNEIAEMKSYFVKSGIKGIFLSIVEHSKDPILLSQVYSWLGEKGATLDCLEKAYEEHNSKLVYLNVYPYDSVRNEPRFIELQKKMRLGR